MLLLTVIYLAYNPPKPALRIRFWRDIATVRQALVAVLATGLAVHRPDLATGLRCPDSVTGRAAAVVPVEPVAPVAAAPVVLPALTAIDADMPAALRQILAARTFSPPRPEYPVATATLL